MTATDPITSVTASVVSRMLPRPLPFGAATISERHYTVVTIHTAAGLTGHAYAQSRGLPVADLISDVITPLVTGRDSAEVTARWRECYRATLAVGRSGPVMRALSLVDIALWDLQAQRAGLPLHRLLGGGRSRVPVMAVVGYPAIESDVDEVVDAGLEAAARGHELIKIARAPEGSVTRAVLERLDDRLPGDVRVVVDAFWTWEQPYAALKEVQTWPTRRLAWLEDPFPPEAVAAYSALRAIGAVPVGAGDEVGDAHVYDSLVAASGLDVIRLDIAAIGGLTPAVRILHRAEHWALPVSLHISAEVGAHVAAAHPGVLHVETFDRRGNRYDPSHELGSGGPAFEGAEARLTDSPGIGWRPGDLDGDT